MHIHRYGSITINSIYIDIGGKLYVNLRYIEFLTMASILIAVVRRIETTRIFARRSEHFRPFT